VSYLLDTAPLAAYIFGRPGAVARLDALIQNGQATTSILTFGEVIEYLRSFPNFGHNEQTLRGLLRNAVRPYALTYTIEIRYADIRRLMRATRGPNGQLIGLIGDIDTLIAATALEHGHTLITADSDYLRVPGLSVQLLTLTQLRIP
jgi:predicted nucleic acid-binding protein